MRIGIDCRMAGKRHAGIGRYIAQVVTHLLDSQSEDEWVLFFRDSQQVNEVLTPSQRARAQIVLADYQHYSLLEQLRMPGVFRRARLDLLHVPHFNVPVLYFGRLLVTIHDLLWHDHRGVQVTTLPRWQYWIKYAFYRLVSSVAIRRAKKILVPTHTVAKTVLRFYPQVKDKVTVIYEGANEYFVALTRSQSKPRSLLYVGSLYPHKNIDVVLKALTQLPDYTLQIVSARSAFEAQVRREVSKLGIEKQVTFLGAVDDEALRQAYYRAETVVCPSLSEGFGLPGIEALACGTTVVASDIPIYQEVYQRSALFFNPMSSQSLINALQKATAKQRESLRKSGLKLVRRYRWSQTAEQTIQAYHTI